MKRRRNSRDINRMVKRAQAMARPSAQLSAYAKKHRARIRFATESWGVYLAYEERGEFGASISASGTSYDEVAESILRELRVLRRGL